MLNHVWGDQFTSFNNVTVNVSHLRKKFIVNGKRLNIIESAWGKGYRLVDPDRDSIKP